MATIWGMVIAGVVITLWLIATYNKLVLLRQNVRESWSAIETELRRRYDLIPNLVETVKGYAGHERETLEEVVSARNKAVSVGAQPDQQAAAQSVLNGALNRLVALQESYPDLKANENFNHLQAELESTETRISQARRFYNANVKEMNAAVQTFPTVLLAQAMGFSSQAYFGLDDPQAAEPIRISFDTANRGSHGNPAISNNDGKSQSGSQSMNITQGQNDRT